MSRIFPTSGCPPLDDLRSLIALTLAPETMWRLESHLDTCLACTQHVQRLVPPTPPLLRAAALHGVVTSPSAEIGYLRLRSALRTPEAPTKQDLLPTSDDFAVFNLSGDYELLERIGRGGMGDVYRARQRRLGRDVAVKTLSSRVRRTPIAVRRLVVEARRLAQIQHPNIVHVYDVGEQQGVPYFSMELVTGSSLGAALKTRRFSPDESARLLAPVADAIAAAHGVGVIHRDVKPDNILLTRDNVPKVTDFGLATTREEVSSRADREVAGTVEYMAPEQWSGDAELVGPWTDVYGLGAVLYQMLTGRPPFGYDSRTNSICVRVLYDLPASPRASNRGVSRDLEAICLRCLEKSPSQRYRTASAVADDLRRYLVGCTVSARPASPPRKTAYWCVKNWLAVSVALVLLFAVGLSTTRYSVYTGRQRKLLEAQEVFDRSQRLANDGHLSQAIAGMQTAIDTIPSDETDLLAYYRQTLVDWLRDHPTELGRYTHPASISLAAVSPDGEKVLLTDETNAVLLWSLSDGTCHTLLPASRRPIRAVAFDHTGKRCAAGGHDSVVRVWDTVTTEKIAEQQFDGWWINSMTFAGPDRLVVGSGKPSEPVRVWRIAPHQPLVPIPLPTQPTKQMAGLYGSPCGRFLARSSDGERWLYDASGRTISHYSPDPNPDGSAMAFSRTGGELAMNNASGQLALFDTETGREIRQLACSSQQAVCGITFGNDGTIVVITKDNGHYGIRQTTPNRLTWNEFSIDSKAIPVILADGRVRILTGLGTTTVVLSQLQKLTRTATTLGHQIARARVVAATDGSRLLTLVGSAIQDQAIPKQAVWELAAWDVRSLTPIGSTLSGRLAARQLDHYPTAIAVRPAGDFAAIACSGGPVPDVFVERIRDEGLTLTSPSGQRQGPRVVIFSANGQRLFTAANDDATLGRQPSVTAWDCSNPAKLRQIRSWVVRLNPTGIAVSRDDEWLAVCGTAGQVLLYGPSTVEIEHSELTVTGGVSAVDFSPDGKTLVVGTLAGRVFVFRLTQAKWSLVTELPTMKGGATLTNFSADGTVLYTAEMVADAGIKQWNTTLWKPIGNRLPVPGTIVSSAIIPNGVVSITTDGQIVKIAHPW